MTVYSWLLYCDNCQITAGPEIRSYDDARRAGWRIHPVDLCPACNVTLKGRAIGHD